MKMPLDELQVFDTESKVITSPVNGNSVELTPEAIAVYDFILGTEMLGSMIEERIKCIDWFRECYPKEYMLLLD
jgi:hypothetical protein